MWCEKKKSQFIGEKWQDRVTRVILSFHALCILIAIRIKIAVYIFHCRWTIKKKEKKKRISIEDNSFERDGKIGNFAVIGIRREGWRSPVCPVSSRLRYENSFHPDVLSRCGISIRFFEIRNNHPGIDDIFAGRMSGRSMANQGIRPIQNGRGCRIFRGEANIGHF